MSQKDKAEKQTTSLTKLLTIPQGLDEYINDYKIKVFEISSLTDEQLDLFQSDFKIIARFFVEKKKDKNYIPKDTTTIEHVDAFLKMLSAITGDARYQDVINSGEDVNNMCEVAERLERKGRAEGREEGLVLGKSEGVNDTLEILSLFDKGYSAAEIVALGYDIEMIEKTREVYLKIAK